MSVVIPVQEEKKPVEVSQSNNGLGLKAEQLSATDELKGSISEVFDKVRSFEQLTGTKVPYFKRRLSEGTGILLDESA